MYDSLLHLHSYYFLDVLIGEMQASTACLYAVAYVGFCKSGGQVEMPKTSRVGFPSPEGGHALAPHKKVFLGLLHFWCILCTFEQSFNL